MSEILYRPRNHLGHYNAALLISREENDYRVTLLAYDYDQQNGEHIVGKKVRGGYNRADFWFLLERSPFEVIFGANNEVEFKQYGKKVSYGDLVRYLDNSSIFRKTEVWRLE